MANIDQDLYNRQIYVLGNQAMSKLTKSNILLYDVGALGVEIAKNLILAGIGSLTIIDEKICSIDDLGNNFFVNESHLAKKLTRSQACSDHLKALNPYVNIIIDKNKNIQDLESDEDYLRKFDCVILSDTIDMNSLIRINEICHKFNVKFLMANVIGLMGWSFNDFGNDEFEVNDLDGEEYREDFIGDIVIEDNKLVIETMNNKYHNLETDDLIKFLEIQGDLNELNNQIYQIKVLDPQKFQINLKNSLDKNSKYSINNGGLFKKCKKNLKLKFEPLNDQLNKPELLLSDLNEQKYFNPYLIHVLFHSFIKKTDCNYQEYLNIVKETLNEFNANNSNLISTDFDEQSNLSKMLNLFYFTRNFKFTPLCAIYGGIIAQEALKSVTNKFIPIKQWLHLEFSDLNESLNIREVKELESVYSKLILNDRYDSLRVCFGGEKTLNKLNELKLFMVGCGAIGCEMLKNYALLGISTNQKGLITITDNDLIEKSNLNRQFLFRQHDIQKPKSSVAANAILKINKDVRVSALQQKVCAQTESEYFNDKFFASLDVCVNALDNVEARRYMDSRCVANQKALLESGTLGAKGHVQVIIPHITESYSTQRDPNDENSNEIPYCTLKSFPSNIEHCIQWARDKFESLFKIKPNLHEKFFDEHKDVDRLINSLTLDENTVINDSVKIAKILKNYCFTAKDCVLMARIKFEKYFSNKAKDLLHAYPLEHLMNDGSLFWKLPRRPPKAIKFDSNEKLHLDFVTCLAKLLCQIFNVQINDLNLNDSELVRNFLNENESKVPEWKPVKKHIETHESKKKVEAETKLKEELDNTKTAEIFKSFNEKIKSSAIVSKMNKLEFEKDDDSNGHIDFIFATSNLRALMYSIETSDRLQVKKVAGKIVPAIATTTSCIAGFVTIELIKVSQGDWKLEKFRNLFLNLGISFFLQSEPGPCVRSKITENCYVTLWDTWSIKGSENFTLRNFIDSVKQKYSLTVSGVIYGTKPIYIPVLPAHVKRINEKMIKLIKGLTKLDNSNRDTYVDLHVTYVECDQDENMDQNNICPPIRYYFS